MPTCPSCQKEVQQQAKFCRFCGQSLAPTAAGPQPAVADAPTGEVSLTDQFPAETLVRRLGPGQMQGLLNKTLLIEEGQSALLLIGGRLDLTLGPGKHSMGNILSSRTRDTTVALLRTADIPLGVSVARLLTSDPLPLDFRLVVKIVEPMRFVNNLASSAEAYTTQSLAAAIYPPVRSGCEEFVGSRSVRELGAGQNTGADLSMALAANLDQQLSRWGLRIISSQGQR